MQIIILAAGSGKRMTPLTKKKHKSLLIINEEDSFLSKLLHQINEYEISKVIIVTGYKNQDVISEVNKYQFKYEIVHNEKFEEDQNILSMKLALDKINVEEPVIIIEADTYIDDLAFKKIYFDSLSNKSIWFTRGVFGVNQYGGILRANDGLKITDIRIVDKYSGTFEGYKKLLGIMAIGTSELQKFRELLSIDCAKSIDSYYLIPWINNLEYLPSFTSDLSGFVIESVNTAEEYYTFKDRLKENLTRTTEFTFCNLELLKPIENYVELRKDLVLKKILGDDVWIKPIIVEKENHLVLDGHHRFQAALEIGLKKIPVFYTSYNDKNVIIWSLKRTEYVSKNIVIKRALAGEIYPHKTVKHNFPFVVGNCNIPLKELFK